MADRMDIDALLIGALYGELTPADEARLTAHLESHPADRNALADLTRTRAQLRESRVLSVQLDPPQSVSALLLQEAARRAPRPQRDADSWFHRFARSFMGHPALAAAAMVVIVAGVASTLYVRHGDEFVHSSAPSLADEGAAAPAASATEPRAAPSPAATSPAAAPPVAAPPPAAPEPTGAGAKGEAATTGAYDVRLAESNLKQDALDRERQVEKVRANSDGRIARDGEAKEAQSGDPLRFSAPPKPTVATAEQKPPQKKTGGIELRTPEPSPRELEKSKVAGGKRGTSASDSRGLDRDDLGKAASDDAALVPKPPARAAEPQAASRPNAQPVAPAVDSRAPLRSEPSRPLGNTGNAGNANAGPRGSSKDAKLDKAPARKAAPGAGQAPILPSTSAAAGGAPRTERQQVDSPATQAPAGPADIAEENDKTNTALVGWARTRHVQVVAFVKSSNCRAAATAAIEIYNRAPDYYAANVATDRSVKPCLPYLASERQREDRMRAAKRANATDAAPSQAAPPPVKK